MLSLFAGMLGRLMVTDDAAGAGAEQPMMAGIMPGNPAHHSALEAALRLGWRRQGGASREREGESRRQQYEFHLGFLRGRAVMGVRYNTEAGWTVQFRVSPDACRATAPSCDPGSA